MKTKLTWLLAMAASAAVSGWCIGVTPGSESKQEKALVHVVLFELKKDAPATAADDLIRDAHERLAKIPVVGSLEIGRRAPGDRPVHVKDYDVGLYLHLKKASDVSAYLQHPLHLEFVEKHTPHVERLRVCDFYDE